MVVETGRHKQSLRHSEVCEYCTTYWPCDVTELESVVVRLEGQIKTALTILDQIKCNNTVALTLLPKLPSSIDEIVSALETSYAEANTAIAALQGGEQG